MNPKVRYSLFAILGFGLMLNYQNCSKSAQFNSESGDGVLDAQSSSMSTSSPTDVGAGTGTSLGSGSVPVSSEVPSTGSGSGSIPVTPSVPEPPSSMQGTIPVTCTVPASQITKSMKIIFVIDTSGSNATGNAGAAATDPNKSFRYGAVEKFLSSYRGKRNFQWQFVTFGNTAATSYLKSATSKLPNFTSDPTQMDSALTAFMKVKDTGDTPYLKAFNEITANVNDDPDRTKSGDPSNYVVIFLSDGVPSDVTKTFTTSGSTWASNAAKLLALSPGHMTLSAVYYGPKDASASAQMQAMATAMGGQFIDTNVSGYNFNVEDIISVPATACQ